MIDTNGVIRWLEDNGAIRRGHFVYTDGGHWDVYTDMSVALNDVDKAIEVVTQMAKVVRILPFETVAGPAHADDKWAFALALELRKLKKDVKFVYAQEETEVVKARVHSDLKPLTVVTGKLVFPRQQRRYVKDHRVLIVCDVVSTGSTAKKMIELIQSEGGVVEAIAVVCGHSQIRDVLGFQVFELLDVPAQMHEPPCPPDAGPIDIELGHGREFLQSQHSGTRN